MSNRAELLQKIKELSERGTGGEQSNAKEILDKLMSKYNISEGELSEDSINDYDIYFKGEYERKLLGQIIFKVTNSVSNIHRLRWTGSGRLIRNQLRVKCTKSQYLEIEYLFGFYKGLWYEELDRFFNAYIIKHEIYSDTTTDKVNTIQPDLAMYNLVNGLSDASPRIALESSDK